MKFDSFSPINIFLFMLVNLMISFIIYIDYFGSDVILIGILGFLFLSLGYYVSNKLLGRGKKIGFSSISVDKLKFNENFKVLVFFYFFLFLISFVGFYNLALRFYQEFGINAFWERTDLFQTEAIVNSYGYLLYLNIFIFVISPYIFVKSRLFWKPLIFLVFSVSVLALIFAGIKSYLFQAILTTIVFYSYFLKFRNFLLLLSLSIASIFILFGVYDSTIDIGALEGNYSLTNRLLAYLFGGWAVLQSLINEGVNYIDYPGFAVLHPIYKVILWGNQIFDSQHQAIYDNFYTIKGLELNVFSLIGYAYIDYSYIGVILFSFFVGLISGFIRYFLLKNINAKNLLIHSYLMAILCLSLFFSNIYGDLQVYTSLLIINLVYIISKSIVLYKRMLR